MFDRRALMSSQVQNLLLNVLILAKQSTNHFLWWLQAGTAMLPIKQSHTVKGMTAGFRQKSASELTSFWTR